MDIIEALENFYQVANIDMTENSSSLKGLSIALQWGDIMKTIRRNFPLVECNNDFIDINLRMFIQIENDKNNFIVKAMEWLRSQAV